MSITAVDLPDKRLLRADEVAECLCISKRTVYTWCENGKLAFIRINGVIRIPRGSVIEIISVSE
jgi:excisionase family DNA binding protein